MPPPTSRKTRAKQAAVKNAPGSKKKVNAAAAKAKAAAEEAKAKGRRLAASKQALRDSLIVARRAQDWPWAAIAEEAGISEKQAMRVHKDAREIRSPLDERPMQLLEDLARGFKLSIGDFEAMAFANVETNPNVALGAKRAADEARLRLMDLMVRTGSLPVDLTVFRSEATLRRVAQGMMQVMSDVRDGKVTVEEAHAFFMEMAMHEGNLGLASGDGDEAA